jgi:hypothetical protein
MARLLKMRLSLSLLLFCTLILKAEIKTNFENSNILTHQQDAGVVDYNRFRLYLDFEDKRWEDISAKIILDNENRLYFKSGQNRNKSSIYRAFLNYTGEKHLVTIGLQRVAFGVGRIWNPIDVFNPIDITAVETNERKGVEAFHYEYAINSLSNFDLTLSKKKQALRVKGFLDVADIAFILIKDDKNSLDIVGYEAEGELGDITLRSEGGVFFKKDYKTYYKYILGAEYGFENSLVVLGEFHHDTNIASRQLALNLSYQPSALWHINFLTLCDVNAENIMFSPSFSLSLSDESNLQVGGFITNKEDRFFVHYFINF